MKKVTISVEVRYTQTIEKEISDELYEKIEDALGETLDGYSEHGDVFDWLVDNTNEADGANFEIELEDMEEVKEA